MADILETLRSDAKKYLSNKDEGDLFNIANNFFIRHANENQKNNYDKDIWYSWMFYFYIATIHALLRIKERVETKKQLMQTESKQQILERRKEIEQELVDMLKETKSDFTLDHVRDVIFHEEDNDDMMKAVMMFDRGGDASALSNVLELVTDAWNYFPHAAVGGKAPVEMRG